MTIFNTTLSLFGAAAFFVGVFLLFFSKNLMGLWTAAQFIWSAIILFFVGVFSQNLSTGVVFKIAITLFSGFSVFSLFFLSLLTRAQLIKKVSSLTELQELRR